MKLAVSSLCLALLAASAAVPPTVLAPAGASPQDPPPAEPTEAPAPEYPTFEIFRSSRMFAFLETGFGEIDLAELASKVEGLASINAQSKDAAERMSGVEKPEGPSARLNVELPQNERGLYSIAPLVMMKLEPLWKEKSWSAEQVALANDGAKIIARFSGAPTVAFDAEKPAEHRAGLEELAKWFREATTKREKLAAMIFTMDDGPYEGLPFEASSPLESDLVKKLDEHLELRIAKVERDGEPFVLQCLRDGKPAWSRVISGLPDGAVRDAGFAKSDAKKTGPYGWHVPFWVQWPYGVEQAHLYVDAKGELLFYYLSW